MDDEQRPENKTKKTITKMCTLKPCLFVLLRLIFLVILPIAVLDLLVQHFLSPSLFVLLVNRSFLVVVVFAVEFRPQLIARQYSNKPIHLVIVAFFLRFLLCLPLWYGVYLHCNLALCFSLFHCITLEVLLPWSWFSYVFGESAVLDSSSDLEEV